MDTLYIATEQPEFIKVYRDTEAQKQACAKDMLDTIRGWGMDLARASDFGAPHEFVKLDPAAEREAKGPELVGFKGGKRTHVPGEGWGYEYSLHKGSPTGKARQAELDELKARHWPAEFAGKTNAHWWGGFEGLVCRRLGLSRESFRGNSLRHSTCFMLNGSVLVVSLPISKEDGVYHLPNIPEGYWELLVSEVITMVNHHNQSIK